MPSITLVLETNKETTEMAKVGRNPQNLQRVASLINGLKAGALQGTITVSTSTADPVAASGTITVASITAADTITIGQTKLTASATPSGEDQFDSDGTDTEVAAAIVTAINDHSVLGKIVEATSAAGVVTVTAIIPGIVGNEIPLTSSNGTRLAVSGSGFLTSGAGGSGTSPLTIKR